MKIIEQINDDINAQLGYFNLGNYIILMST